MEKKHGKLLYIVVAALIIAGIFIAYRVWDASTITDKEHSQIPDRTVTDLEKHAEDAWQRYEDLQDAFSRYDALQDRLDSLRH